MNLSRFVKVIFAVKLNSGYTDVAKKLKNCNQLTANVGVLSSSLSFRSFFNNSVSNNLQQQSSNMVMHSEISRVDFANLSIIVIPATADNFMYLIIDRVTQNAAAVDPVEPERILDVLQLEQATLTTILTTHHHWDHAGGNEKLVQLIGKQNGNKLEVYGGDNRVEALTKTVGQDDKIELGSLKISCLHTPCHTTGHICYFIGTDDPKVQKPAVFTGDTLFIAGCGRFFEGTATQMYDALINKLGSLPDETLVYCGHEYTVNNLKFALSSQVEPTNEDAIKKLAWAEDQRIVRKPTVPSTIAEERRFNPFMRCIVADLQQKVGTSDAVGCMGTLRSMKDNFKC